MILANTVMGKGVKFMEGDEKYHGSPLKADQYKLAMADLGLPDRLEELKKIRETRSFPKVGAGVEGPGHVKSTPANP